MDHSDSKAPNPERRTSVRTSARISLQQDGLEVGDDEYILAMGMISDGFRPQPSDISNLDSAPRPRSIIARPDSSTVAQSSPDPESPSRPSRSSIQKPPRSRDSFTLRHDGPAGHLTGPSLSRVSSASTNSPVLRDETQYEGPSAPSHPYQMYSQNPQLARTASIATTSTTFTRRPESEYVGPSVPSHPYSMYPQNPVEDSSSHTSTVPAIPVGFTNTPDLYQRRLGPEGEDVADIIGPDGHTEELPPYTRYPDEFYARKIRDNEEAQQGGPAVRAAVAPGAATAAATADTAITSMPAIPPAIPPAVAGAGGIGLAARNPEFDSTDGSAQSRHSIRSFGNESHHEINTAAAAISEKQKQRPLNKYQKFAKRKACGVVPYWAICLTTGAVVIVVVIVAAVIGSILSKHKKPPHDSQASPSNYQDSVPTVTVTYDATPIPTPSDLPALPTGTFALPLNLNQAPNTCFNDTAQSSAWSCQISFQYAVQMQMIIYRNAPQLGEPGNYDVFLGSNASQQASSGMLAYGAQPPKIEPAMNMELVNDTFDLDRGPAWFRMVPYNKTVVVPEDLLSASTSSKARRNLGGFMPTIHDFMRKGVAQSGDKPWICNWPDTFVEVFVYAEQNSSWASQTGAPTITSVPSTMTEPPSTTPTSTTASTGSAATATATDQVSEPMPIAAYPRAVKVKERRVNHSPQPYCVQVQVMPNNSTQPVTDSDGNQVTVYIEEEEPGPGMKKRSGDELLDTRERRDALREWLFPRDGNGADMSACGCMWFSS